MADPRRTQRRDRRRPPPPQAGGAAGHRAPRRSGALADRLDDAHYRDDILRLLFICCHPDLPATQQIALALRIVSGLAVAQIARAFLVGETAMEQRITRARTAAEAAHIRMHLDRLQEDSGH